MTDGHVGIWLSATTDDVEAVAWPARPAEFVRFNLHGSWPGDVDGVPVVPVYELTPRSIKDEAYAAAVAWLGEASRVVGASGWALREQPSPLGIPLWWGVDLLAHDTIVLWIRAVQSVHHVLARRRPRTVSVWGNDDKLPWMRDTVLAVLRQRPELEVLDVAPPDAVSRASHRWKRAGAELAGAWEAPVPPGAVFGPEAGPRSRAEVRDGRVRLVSLGSTLWFSRALDREVTVVETVMRRPPGPEQAVGFALDTGRARQTVNVGVRGLTLGTGEFRAHDTATTSRYTLEVTGRASILHVDGHPFLQGRVLPGTAPELRWGHLTGTGDVESEWLAVAWGRRGPRTGSRGWLGRVTSWFHGPHAGVPTSGPAERLAPLRRLPAMPPDGEASTPGPPGKALDPGAIVVMTFGDELRWFEDDGRPALYDQISDNLVEAFRRRGHAAVRLTLGPISPDIPRALREPADVVELRHWRLPGDDEAILAELMAAWRAWRGGAPGETRFPEYRGVSIDGTVARLLEGVLPYQVGKVHDVRALAAFCAASRPRAVVFTHFVSSQRHLIEAARGHDALTAGIAIGCDSQDHLFYGIRDQESGCPRADLYSVWGGRELEALERSGTLGVDVLAPGRTRQDTFVTYRSPDGAGWLRRLGLPPAARRVVVFGDVLCSTNGAPILTSASCEALLRGILRALAGRPDVHVLYKPWRGDDLRRVRAVVGRLHSERVHVVDPHFLPFHNLDVLRHAVTLVTSPTSMLAEFAAMGGLPILLALPETAYYHGPIIEALFAPFCLVVEDVGQIEAAVAAALRADERGTSAADGAGRAALAHAFGEPDGRSADRLAEAILTAARSSSRRARPGCESE